MKLFGRDITNGPPIIVAEIGAGHNGSIDRALALIGEAKKAGADAVKIQCYEPHNLTIYSNRPEFIVMSPLWEGKTLWDLYTEAHTPVEWMEPMFLHAKRIGIPIFASVFDPESIPVLQLLGNPAYKIASFELVDIPLIKAAAATGKPIIMSTGMATEEEICDALNAASPSEVVLLHCVSGYPTPVGESNLTRMDDLTTIRRLGYDNVGISDHTLGDTVPIAATVMGAKIIEKHFCLFGGGGPDAEFSMNPDEFKDMVKAVHDAWAALQPSSSPSEDVNRKYRRSLYVVRDVKAGEPFTRENVRSIRPANGLPPKHMDRVLTCRAAYDIEAGTPLSDNMILYAIGNYEASWKHMTYPSR